MNTKTVATKLSLYITYVGSQKRIPNRTIQTVVSVTTLYDIPS